MRTIAIALTFLSVVSAFAADVESRVLTTYVPQDLLETMVRTEGWTDLTLNVKGGVRKGDTVRLWCGGVVDRGNGDKPGENCNGPEGVALKADDKTAWALSSEAGHGFAMLFRSDAGVKKAMPTGKALEIKLLKDGEKVQFGFNDERGRYADNHLGKGRRHELDPLWIRVEVVRMVVD
jgi:hypothetical protein